MKKLLDIGWKILTTGGGWAPSLVFLAHVFLSLVLDLFDLWPSMDIPFHFLGGTAIAFFVSRCFQLLPRESAKRSRVVFLELVLIGSLTATAAVFWEFAEFTIDQVLGINTQVSLANTMIDLAMGVSGGTVVMLIRSRQLRIKATEVQEIIFDWVYERAA